MVEAGSLKAIRLAALREELKGVASAPATACLGFGLEAIDAHLPAGGLAAGLHEFCPAGPDLPCDAAAAQLSAFLLGRAAGPVVWVLSRRCLFAPGLAEAGLAENRVIYAEAGNEKAVLAIAEEALRHSGLAGVVAETHRLGLTPSRRLQLAAEASQTPCLVLRRWQHGKPPAAGTAALTRWRLGAFPSSDPAGLPRAAWRLELVRCRGGQPHEWHVELEAKGDARPSLSLRLVAELASPAAGEATGQKIAA